MFKKIPGNHKYSISLDGKIRCSDGSDCAPIIVNGKVVLEIYGECRSVDVSWLALLAHYEVDLPDEFKCKIWNIKFVSCHPKLKLCKRVMCFDIPVTIQSGFRLIPGFTNYAVDKHGNVINVKTRQFVSIHRKDGHYPSVKIKDPDRNRCRAICIHRLVCWAWIDNNDFINKRVVNHKDGNKNNSFYRNLEWCTYKHNNEHAFRTGLRTDNVRCKIRDAVTKEVMEFPSVEKACEYMNVHKYHIKDFQFKRRTKLVDNRYEVKLLSDDTPWFYEDKEGPLCPGRYEINAIFKDGSSKMFYDVRSMIKELQIYNTPSQGLKCIMEYAEMKYPGIKFEVVDHFYHDEVQALNVDTGEIVEAVNFSEMSKLIGVNRNTINYALKKGKDFVKHGYAFRFKTTEPWDIVPILPKTGGVRILASNLKTNEQIEFTSLREAAKYFNVDRSVIKTRYKVKGVYRDWVLQEIE